MISIIGYYPTQFGELWDKSLFDLVVEAESGVVASAHIAPGQIDAIFFGNMLGGILENNLHGGAKISGLLHTNIPIFRVESACASGGAAFHLACGYVESGRAKTVMVIGAEKMTDCSPEQVVTALSSAASGEEQEAGLTFPGLYAMLARVYLEKYHYSERNLAYVSVKNHFHGSLNSKAHFKRKITVDDVLESSFVADPLKVLDCSPISDGAAAVIISNDQKIIKKRKSTSVLATEMASDSISLSGRTLLDGLLSTQLAAEKAFKKSKTTPSDISVAEVHDCFSIAELLAMEDLGFWKKGTAGKKITALPTQFGSGEKLIVNTSGGLKAAGHPVGATGIKQIGELYLQLTGQAENRQVKSARYGLAHNVGGSGGTAVVTILGK